MSYIGATCLLGDVDETNAYHEALKSSAPVFFASTERLPHMPDVEAVQGGLIYRNCIQCRSTLVLAVAAEPLDDGAPCIRTA